MRGLYGSSCEVTVVSLSALCNIHTSSVIESRGYEVLLFIGADNARAKGNI